MTEEWNVGYDEGFMAGWNEAQTEIKHLHESNQAMLDALKRIAAIENHMNGGDWDEITEAQEIAEAVIAKAEGMNKVEQQT